MIVGAGHSASFVDIKVPAVDRKKDDTCSIKVFQSVGEIKDKDEARVPPLPYRPASICSAM